MLREKLPELSIGYSRHIPLPLYELFRVLPQREEILKGLLGADLIAFRTHDYMRHFVSTAYRVLGLERNLDEKPYSNRIVDMITAHTVACLAEMSLTQLTEALARPLLGSGLLIIKSNKIVEIKSAETNKVVEASNIFK